MGWESDAMASKADDVFCKKNGVIGESLMQQKVT
jgi:hypothetical protein